MISIYMIITSVASTALAKGFMECNLSEPTGAHQCFGAVGQTLIFNIPNTANTEIKVTKDDKYLIFKRDTNKRVTYNESGDFTNQTFKINNATERHSGVYQMEEFAINGTLLKEVKVHLEIRAPVSEPAVSQTCLSPEQMEVSCSSEGDEVQFMLSLDDHLLMQTRTYNQSQRNWDKQNKADVSNVTISLFGQLTGNLTCRVWNNVSRDEKIIHLKSCKDCVSCFPVVTVAVIASVVTLLLHVALSVGLKHLQKKTTTITVDEDNPDNEIVYSEVRVMKNTRKT